MRMHKPIFVVALVGLLAACASVSEPQLSYDAGYRVGCRAGKMFAGRPIPEPLRDEVRYQTNAAYADGYNTAVEACYAEARRTMPNWNHNGR